MAKTSPDSARDIRIVRSLSASEIGVGPEHELLLDQPIGLVIVGEHLQPRAGADAVVGQGRDDPPGVAVVGDLVAGAAAEDGADAGIVGGVGRQQIGAGPVPAVLLGGHRGIVAPANVQGHADGAERAPRLAASEDVLHQSQHQSVPGGTSFFRPIAQSLAPCGLLAFEIAVGRDLVGQRVLLHAARIPVGLQWPLGVLADRVFQVVSHRSAPVAGPGVAPGGRGL